MELPFYLAPKHDIPSPTHQVFVNEALPQNFLVEELAGKEDNERCHSLQGNAVGDISAGKRENA